MQSLNNLYLYNIIFLFKFIEYIDKFFFQNLHQYTYIFFSVNILILIYYIYIIKQSIQLYIIFYLNRN